MDYDKHITKEKDEALVSRENFLLPALSPHYRFFKASMHCTVHTQSIMTALFIESYLHSTMNIMK